MMYDLRYWVVDDRAHIKAKFSMKEDAEALVGIVPDYSILDQTIKFLEVYAYPRYWEDATVNGVVDEEGTFIPFRKSDEWNIFIDLETGIIEDWPQGTTASIHYKVCDAGFYYLTNSKKERRYRWSGYYVPSDLLAHEKEGYGDYIILDIDSNGKIANWNSHECSKLHNGIVNSETWVNL